MTLDQARVAVIIAMTECAWCGAPKKRPCRDQKRGRIWVASVHYGRREQAAKIRKNDILLWRRLLAQAKEMDFLIYAEYLRQENPST